MKHLRAPFPRLRADLAPWPAALALALALAAPVHAATGVEALAPLADAGDILTLLNAQRAAGAVCGDEVMPPAPPLHWHPAMEQAATDHVQDVATRPALTHVGSDGSSVGRRVWRHGYVWGGVGENVAGGHRGAADTLRQWLASPPHCRTLMATNYRDVAVVGRYFPGSRLGHYWVMVVARPMR